MKFLFISFILLIWGDCLGQRQYRCIYIDTTTVTFPDSILKMIQKNLDNQELPPQVIDQLSSQIVTEKIFQIQEKEVLANKDSTIIRFLRETREGNLHEQSSLDSILFKNDEIYLESPGKSGFSSSPVVTAKKMFQPSGDTMNVMHYKCIGYISTDSLCSIWISHDLPSYLNPGIRTRGLKGAVLAYWLKSGKYFIKSKLKRIE